MASKFLLENTTTATYYFDGTGGISDLSASWTNDANAFDGNTGTSATATANTPTDPPSIAFLYAKGTTAPTTGDTIFQVRARTYGGVTGTAGGVLNARVYTASLAENLGLVSNTNANATPGYSSYTTLTAPSAGWTWAVLDSLEVKTWIAAFSSTTNANISLIEIEVTYGITGVDGYLLEDGTGYYLPESPVYVDLNTADASAFSTSTPTLEFTGTQLDDDDIRYNIEISNMPDSSSLPAVGVGGVFNYSVGPGGVTTGLAQSFIAPYNFTLHTAGFTIRKGTAVPTGTLALRVYAHTGVFGVSSMPTGSALAVSDTFDPNTLTNTLTSTKFTFSGANQIALTAGTPYALSLEYTDGGGSHTIQMKIISGNPNYHPGNNAYKSGSTWVVDSGVGANTDLEFYVSDNDTPFIRTKVSGTDAGFVNTVNGGDTDPFTTGQKISYTVQTGEELPNESYSWRVRGLDPSGSNAYGDWATPRKFTVLSSGGTTGQIKVYNGSSFVAKPVKVYNGTAFVLKPLKRWNGSAWVVTNY